MAKKKDGKVDGDTPLDLVLDSIHKKFGEGSIFRVNSESIHGAEVLSSGFISVDEVLGGGAGKGRIVEIFGDPSTGKSSMCLHFIAQAQAEDPEAQCAFVDVENALDLKYAKDLEVDTDRLLISQPDSAEQALEIVDMLVRSGSMKVIVLDSVAALVPAAELEGQVGDQTIGLQARLMSQALRKITGVLNKSGTVLIFTNQMRAVINQFGHGPKSIPGGGNSLKFYASQRIELKRIGSEKQGEEVIGNKILIKVAKNKIAPPFKTTEVVITFGRGINREQEIIDLGIKHGLIKRAAAWLNWEEEKWCGMNKAIEALYFNKEMFNKLKSQVLEKMGE